MGWPQRLRLAMAQRGDAPTLLLIAPGVMPDAFNLAQWHDALTQNPGLAALSPVSASEVREAWSLSEDTDAILEAWTWSPHRPMLAALDPRCALWTRAAAQRVVEQGHEGGVTTARLPHLALALPGQGLGGLIDRDWRPRHLVQRLPRATAAGRDERPVILHVLHDWGGGVARFVADQMREDPDATHLALISSGNRRHGADQQLALHLDLEACPIRTWRCTPAIGDFADTHPTMQAALEETLASFGVAALRVSSLIGGTLDVLRTGLPTAFVVHDLFPLWPWLDDQDENPAWNAQRLAEAAGDKDWPFAERRPEVWRHRAETTIAALSHPNICLVAPSRTAAERLAGIAAPLTVKAVIAHGVNAPPHPAPRLAQRRPGPLRVLVPGRLQGGKGAALLDALLPCCPAGIDWCFAGGGPLAKAYAEGLGGQVIADYAPEQLAPIVTTFDPDLALLPSLLPETFGYVLSEMQALGVPVLASNRGAYGERASVANTGLAAAAPCPEAFAAALQRLVAAPIVLPRQLPAPPSLAASRRAWAALQAMPVKSTRSLETSAIAILQHSEGMLRATGDWLKRERDTAYLAHARDTGDLIQQRDVAMARVEALMQNQAHENAQRERDLAYAYYERDTADLIRQRDVALAQRDAAQEQLEQAQRLLAQPLLRWLIRAYQRGGDRIGAWRYRLARGIDLARRGLRSLRQRGVTATWSALLRRFGTRPQPSAIVETIAPPLGFAPVALAKASIVIPVYGKLDFSLACLRSLVACGLPEGTEVIVVDDASPDDSGTVLPGIPGLRYHRNTQNLGFVGSCNAGAALARGEFLVFLNNDTTLSPGWLEALLRTFDTHPDTGLAGAQLVYPDGRLQESGGIVFADGSGWNYGRFEDPRHPAYTFVREVDYCSGAAIALPRVLFEQLGGFDARYAPAYYEDTDLAMKVRETGLKVRVQPASVVIHHEGITAGTDTGSGVKAFQLRNQQRFLERWRDTLARRHPPPTQTPHYAAQHQARARVLVIDATTPMPDRDSGSVRLFELLRLLLDEGCAVTFFPENGLDDGHYTQALRAIGVEAWTQPWLTTLPDWLAKHGGRFQLIIVSRHYVLAPLLPLLRRHAPQARIVFDTVDLHHLREQREAEERGDAALQRAAARTRSEELALITAVDRTWVVSPVEKALLAEALPAATIDIVSNIHRVRGPGPGMTGRHGLLFVGGFRHPPNVDAALWLAHDILPQIRAKRPDIGLSLVGSDAPPEILALDGRDGIRVHGHVPDLEPLLDAHRYSVAPLRYGAGVKGKVNTALAHGLPVLATPCAVEGMGLTHGSDVLVAEGAEAFAEAVIAAYDDAALWQRLAEGGLANTEREFSPERARQALRSVFAPPR